MRASSESASLRTARPRSSRRRASARSRSAGAASAVDVGTMPARPSTTPGTRARPVRRAARTALARRRSIASVIGAPSAVASVTASSPKRGALRCRTSTPIAVPPPISGTPTNAGNCSSPSPGMCLYAASAAARSADTGRMHSATSPVMPSPTASAVAPIARRREAVVAAHHEAVVVLAHVDARDVDVRDRRDLPAHRGQHGLDRPVVAGELDQPQDAVDAARAAVMDDDVIACGHAAIVGARRRGVDP